MERCCWLCRTIPTCPFALSPDHSGRSFRAKTAAKPSVTSPALAVRAATCGTHWRNTASRSVLNLPKSTPHSCDVTLQEQPGGNVAAPGALPIRRTKVLMLVSLLSAGCAAQTVNSELRVVQDISALTAKLNRDTANDDVRTRVGVSYRKLGRPLDARPLLESVVERRSGNEVALLHLGLTFETLGRYGDARRVYQEYLPRCRARTLCADLKRRLALLDRRELETLARQALLR